MLNRRQFVLASTASLMPLPLMASPVWQTSKALPYAVQEIYPVVHNNQIIVAGGLYVNDKGSIAVAKTVIAYDLTSKEWTYLPELPEPRHHPMLCSVKGKLFSFSGFVTNDNGRWVASRDVMQLDEENGRWLKLDTQMPFPMCETVSMVRGNDVHLATGRRPSSSANSQWRDQTDINHHLIYDTEAQQWREGAPAPTARNSAAAAVIDGLWYVVGGRTVDEGNKSMTEVYDPAQDKWFSRANMPQAQGGLAAAPLNGKLYVFGGEYFNDGGGVYPEVWEYDPGRDFWRQTSFMPVPRHGLGALTIDSSIYVIAGAARAGGSETSDRMSIYTPE